MADVVLIHGIDQQQKSADLLEKDWLPALAGGVRTAYPLCSMVSYLKLI
jgi:hypothetical protein